MENGIYFKDELHSEFKKVANRVASEKMVKVLELVDQKIEKAFLELFEKIKDLPQNELKKEIDTNIPTEEEKQQESIEEINDTPEIEEIVVPEIEEIVVRVVKNEVETKIKREPRIIPVENVNSATSKNDLILTLENYLEETKQELTDYTKIALNVFRRKELYDLFKVIVSAPQKVVEEEKTIASQDKSYQTQEKVIKDYPIQEISEFMDDNFDNIPF